jgi:hypothetical protein
MCAVVVDISADTDFLFLAARHLLCQLQGSRQDCIVGHDMMTEQRLEMQAVKRSIDGRPLVLRMSKKPLERCRRHHHLRPSLLRRRHHRRPHLHLARPCQHRRLRRHHRLLLLLHRLHPPRLRHLHHRCCSLRPSFQRHTKFKPLGLGWLPTQYSTRLDSLDN